MHAALAEGERVADAVAGAGFGSESRVYEKSGALLGMTPGAARRGGAGEAIRAAFADLGVEVTLLGHEHAVRHPRDNALTRALRVAIRAQGGTPTFKVKTGTSDMNVVAPHWPVPSSSLSPPGRTKNPS